jgi:hypothetical protein
VVTAGIGGAVISADSSRKALHGQQDALAAQQAKLDNLSYTPIDIEQIKSTASQQAQDNIAQSIALEKQYSPGVAASREGLQTQIAAELKQGGNLSADARNAIASSGLAGAGASGIPGAGMPMTAARLGTSAQDLINQRQAKASSLLGANQLPTSGIDPGSLASLLVANNTQANNFDLAKAGANMNLTNSNLQVNAAGGAGQNLGSLVQGQSGNLGQLAGGLGSLFKGNTSDPSMPNFNGTIGMDYSLKGSSLNGAGMGSWGTPVTSVAPVSATNMPQFNGAIGPIG